MKEHFSDLPHVTGKGHKATVRFFPFCTIRLYHGYDSLRYLLEDRGMYRIGKETSEETMN